MHNREGISPLDKCLRRARFIREQTLAYSASAVFADTNILFKDNNPEEKIMKVPENEGKMFISADQGEFP